MVKDSRQGVVLSSRDGDAGRTKNENRKIVIGALKIFKLRRQLSRKL